MIFWGFVILYGTYNSHPAAPPYVPPHGRYVAGNIGHTPNLVKKVDFVGPKFTTPLGYGQCTVTGGCRYWPSIRGIKLMCIGFQSMVLLILDNMFLYRLLGFAFCAPKIGLKSPYFGINRDFGVKMTKNQRFSVYFNMKYLSKLLPYETD